MVSDRESLNKIKPSLFSFSGTEISSEFLIYDRGYHMSVDFHLCGSETHSRQTLIPLLVAMSFFKRLEATFPTAPSSLHTKSS